MSNQTTASSIAEPASPLAGGRDVHLRDLTIAYQRGSQTVVPIEAFNLYAPSSRITALVGRSGSGKTSILSCIAGMLRPTAGAIWLGGIDVTSLSGRTMDAYRRNHVGLVHQSYNLIASLRAIENVAVPLTLIGVPRRDAMVRATALLDEFGLADVAHRRPDELSGGQQQRVAVARALATSPSVVLADEPTAHLDGSSVADVRAMFRAIADSGRTVILATHDDRLLSLVDQSVQLG